jgi:hypothetical protein
MKRATWIFVVALVAGCGTVQTSRVMTGSSQPAYGGNVSVLMDGVALPRNAVEVALVSSRGTGTMAKLEDVIAGLQAEAGSLGCDCVARVKFDQGATIATATGVCLKTH